MVKIVDQVKTLFTYFPILFLLIYSVSSYIIPDEFWFSVKKIVIADTKFGDTPKMVVVRSVNYPFRGKWIVTVKSFQDEREKDLTIMCVASGDADYRPESLLPIDLDLNWWTFPVKCDLPKGHFIVDTSWVFQGMFINRTVRMVSNIFEIK